MKRLIPYKDLHLEPEDERIRQIGEKCMREKFVVGFIVDDEPGKADRYIRKLQERYPGIRVTYRGKGPTPHVETVKVEPPLT